MAQLINEETAQSSEVDGEMEVNYEQSHKPRMAMQTMSQSAQLRGVSASVFGSRANPYPDPRANPYLADQWLNN